MKKQITAYVIGLFVFMIASCGGRDAGERQGSSTSTDSVNVHGRAPATYGGHDPASIQDTTYPNHYDSMPKANTGSVEVEGN